MNAGSGVTARLRSLTSAGPLLLRRRARRDRVLLVVWTLTVAFASLLAVVGPEYLSRTVDAGAREAVESAGSAADLVIEVAVAPPDSAPERGAVPPADVVAVAEMGRERLPDVLGRAHDATTVAVTGRRAAIGAAEVQPELADPDVALQVTLAMLTADGGEALRLLDGRLPVDDAGTDPQAPIEIVASDAAASLTSLGVGSVMPLPATDPQTGEDTVLAARVVGIVAEPAAGADRVSPFRDLPELFDPTTLDERGSTLIGVTVLTPPGSVARAVRARGIPFAAVIRHSFDPDFFTADLLGAAADESRQVAANGGVLIDGYRYGFEVEFAFAEAVADFPARARATIAEFSIIVAGMIGVVSVVLLLVSRLIVGRRLPDVLLERARGASLAAIGLRTLVESALCAGVALLIALAVTRIAGLGALDDNALLVVVLIVALLAGVVQTVAAVGVRSVNPLVGVNRRDALRRARRRRVARITAEAAVVGVAAVAIVALVDRGLLQTQSDGVDPLIAAAPLLSAIATTVLVLRLARWPLAVTARAMNRARGIAGPVAASRSRRALGILPLTALTIAVALVVGTGLIEQTVSDGQRDASWQRVGADVRVGARVNPDEIARIAAADGVIAASGLNLRPGRQLSLGTSRSGVTLLAVDRGYAALVELLPDVEGVTDAADADEFGRLAVDVTEDGPLPVIVDAAIADRLLSDEVSVRVDDQDVALTVVGTVRSGPVGYIGGPVIYVDLASLSARLTAPLLPNTVLALGPGAETAIETLDAEASDVLTRGGWLAERRDSALVAGVQRAVFVGAMVLALLALVTVVCGALAGSRERARYLALLRTLGVPARFGILLAAVDQVPLVVASLAGGLTAGLGIAVLLSPALGLEFLTGGLSAPRPSIPPSFLLLVSGGVVLVFAVGTLIEILLRRRDRVSDAIRVGETV